MLMDSATSTSRLGSTWIQRGWSRPAANGLTVRPGAATGVCPRVQPWAVGILSVGIRPCGFAVGIVGELPQAGSCAPSVSRRDRSAAPPISATTRAKMSEKLNARSPLTRAARDQKPNSERPVRLRGHLNYPQHLADDLQRRAPAEAISIRARWPRLAPPATLLFGPQTKLS